MLLAALLHAGWNALVKSSSDKTADTALVHLCGGAAALPLLLWLGPARAEAWPYIVCSLVVHVGYYVALAGAYTHGDLGLTYPIMRGAAPLLTAAASGVFIGEAPTPAAWLGVVAIAFGVALVGLSARGGGELRAHRAALGYALANALIIAVYTIVDGRGVRVSGDALRYVVTLFAIDGFPFALLVWWRRGAAGRRALAAYARRRWPVAAAGGAASGAAYGIALWAMTRAPVASVAALRETSVLFAAVFGTMLLKERFGLQRAVGTVVVVAGVVVLRVA